MKFISIFIAAVISSAAVHAQTVTYDIPFGQTIGLQQTTGDICSAPFNVEEAFQDSAGNMWGFTWTSTNSGVATSVEITLGFTVTDGGGNFPTTLNGSAGFNVTDGTAKNCENSTLLTWSVDPANYVSGSGNTFLVDFATATNVSQVENLPFIGDPFFRVTVEYTPCTAVDTTVSVSGDTLTSNATNATYQWFDCESGMIISGETDSSFIPTITGEYGVIVTDTASGCKDTSVCTQITITDIYEHGLGSLNIYPNPVQQNLVLELSDFDGQTTIFIYDLQGRLVLTESTVVHAGTQVRLNLSELPAGQYQLRAVSRDRNGSAVFVKN